MKQLSSLLLITATLTLFGSGCWLQSLSTAPSSTAEAPRTTSWRPQRQGVEIITKAKTESGPEVSVTDGGTGRILKTQLPATFMDNVGRYTTNISGEAVTVQLAVGGTIEKDRELLGQLPGLTQLEDATVGSWHVVTAYQDNQKRWIARATLTDMVQPADMYHVIECIGTEKTDSLFWDGCRTLIEHATVAQSRATKTP